MNGLKFTRWISLILGILFILSGIFNLLNPIESVLNLVKTLAIILIVVGVMRLLRYFSYDVFMSSSFLIGGCLDIILGLIMLSNIEISSLAFINLIGFWVLVHGIIELASAIDFKKLGIQRWYLTLLNSILGIVFGFILITNSVISNVFISSLIAIYLFSFGLSFISTFFALSRFRRLF